MVIQKTNIERIAVFPPEHQAVLVIHPDTVVSSKIAFEALQAIRRRDAQILQADGASISRRQVSSACS